MWTLAILMDDAIKREDAVTGVTSQPDSQPTALDSAMGSHTFRAAMFPPGATIAGRYEVTALLGEGGMGAVYKAHDRELDRVVALKFIRPELASDPEILRRFKQEIILAREITHRNVVRIYDVGESEGIKFVSMEFVEGESLAAVLKRRGKIASADAAGIMQQVFDGLAAAHACHVIHRDLKPANIMCASEGRIVIMDFGLARQEAASGLTRTGAVLGTVEYMSPEQAQGLAVDARCDLFTAGMIFYELLTGVRPYQADSAVASLVKRTHERPQPARSCDPTIPAALSNICSKCLQVNPGDRYQSAAELLADLDGWMTSSGVSRSTSSWARAQGTLSARRVPWRAIAITAVVAVVAVVASIFFLRPRPASTATHAPISVLVADFANHTGDPVFDGTLEPAFNVAMEGASFINAFNRGTARKLAHKLPNSTDKLDEQPARLVAVSEGVSAVITGELNSRGGRYGISATALDAVSGKVLAKAEVTAADKDEVLLAIPKLAAPIRKALGDTTPESVQLQSAGGAFTAASLEAVHQYGVAMEQQFAGKMQDALRSFSNAVQLDPNFARAYSGMAVAYRNLGQKEEAEKYIKMAMAHVDRLTERERYRVRGTYYSLDENWPKCIEEYSELVGRYPADNIGHNNLAYCYSHVRDLAKAVEQARKAVANQPNAAGWRVNLSLFSSYAGDFPGGESEARKVQQLNPAFEYGYLALAFSQLGQGQLTQAAETYHSLEKAGALGASWSASGLADLALYEGRFAEAARILEQGAAVDHKAKNQDAAADKFATLAYVQLWMQHRQLALAAANQALSNNQSVKIRFLAAQTFVDAGEVAKARKLAAGLASELSAEPQAYAKVIEGESALKGGDPRQAIQALTQANNLLDTWIGRFELGRAYMEAGAFAEADSEFDRCMKRRGETLALFLDEAPTYGYFPPVYYYQGRVREGLKSPGFGESYRTYLDIRGQAGEDPLLPELRRRAGQ